MPPPLMCQLVCSNEVSEIDVRWLLHRLNKADSFRVRNRVWKRLREGAVPWKLKYSELAELKWTESLLIESETRLRGIYHILHIKSMRGQMVNLYRNRTVRSLVRVPR